MKTIEVAAAVIVDSFENIINKPHPLLLKCSQITLHYIILYNHSKHFYKNYNFVQQNTNILK